MGTALYCVFEMISATRPSSQGDHVGMLTVAPPREWFATFPQLSTLRVVYIEKGSHAPTWIPHVNR